MQVVVRGVRPWRRGAHRWLSARIGGPLEKMGRVARALLQVPCGRTDTQGLFTPRSPLCRACQGEMSRDSLPGALDVGSISWLLCKPHRPPPQPCCSAGTSPARTSPPGQCCLYSDYLQIQSKLFFFGRRNPFRIKFGILTGEKPGFTGEVTNLPQGLTLLLCRMLSTPTYNQRERF